MNRWRFFLGVSCFILVCLSDAAAQDLFMRRTNSVGSWKAQINNNGLLFNETDSAHLPPVGAGGLWYDPQNNLDTVVFGCGVWLGGLRRSGDTLAPHVEYSYDANTALSVFVPGSILGDGPKLDTTQAGRDKYRVYRSTDLTGPEWPIRDINGVPHYIDDIASRTGAGAKSVFGDEDMLVIYKDTDPLFDTTHRPFGVEIRTQISFWRQGFLKDFTIIHNEIIYTGSDTVFDPVVALALDGDIQAPDNDRIKGVVTEGAASTVFFTDGSTIDPFLAVTFLRGLHGTKHPNAGMTSLRYWDITDDPTNDQQRYDFLIQTHRDTALSKVGDARVLMASLSHQALAPGDTVYFDYALGVQPASGLPALSNQDSARMLAVTQKLVSHYYANTLWQLGVRQDANREVTALYPNPASSTLHVGDAGGKVQVFDLLGRSVLETTSENDEIDVRNLTPGSYYLRRGKSGEFGLFEVIH